jgi:hypothetical protein
MDEAYLAARARLVVEVLIFSKIPEAARATTSAVPP